MTALHCNVVLTLLIIMMSCVCRQTKHHSCKMAKKATSVHIVFICFSFVFFQHGKKAVTASLPRLHPATPPCPSPTLLKGSPQHHLFLQPREPTQAAGHQTTPRLCSAHAWSPSRLTPTRPTREPSSVQVASTARAHQPRSKRLRRKRRVSPCLPN